MTCTIHFRYITPVLLYGAVGVGLFWSSSKKRFFAKTVLGVVAVGVVATALLSTILYTGCLPPLAVA